ncbi:hypothetical protein GCM10011345_33020 [Gemmobacter megaterium]|nr:hypothetical protein GCM10011345_33020 [Gemmobacter megaterium]
MAKARKPHFVLVWAHRHRQPEAYCRTVKMLLRHAPQSPRSSGTQQNPADMLAMEMELLLAVPAEEPSGPECDRPSELCDPLAR